MEISPKKKFSKIFWIIIVILIISALIFLSRRLFGFESLGFHNGRIFVRTDSTSCSFDLCQRKISERYLGQITYDECDILGGWVDVEAKCYLNEPISEFIDF